jgi:hypothetical protein
MRRKNFASVAMRSRTVPWRGRVFSMKTWPPSSKMRAFTSPGLSAMSSGTERSPESTFSRVSKTHCGQSESVVRGVPSGGRLFSRLFSSGAGAHFGWKRPSAIRRLTTAATFQAP